jgi:hypothetical protein
VFKDVIWTALDYLLSDAFCFALWSHEKAKDYETLLRSLMKGSTEAGHELALRPAALLARASVSSSVLVPEALANSMLRKEDFPEAGTLYKDIDYHLPALAKIAVALRLWGKAGLNLGDKPVQRANELIELRDDGVHPKVRRHPVNAPVFAFHRTNSKVLGIAVEPEQRTPADAKTALEVALTFVDHVLLDVAGLTVKEARLRVFTRVTDTNDPDITIPTNLMSTAPTAMQRLGLRSRMLEGLPVVNE